MKITTQIAPGLERMTKDKKDNAFAFIEMIAHIEPVKMDLSS